jgi:guanylate kinase
MKGSLIIISSPSGGGKGTLIRRILHDMPEIKFSVSYTTRLIRDGEVDGREYFFVDRADFEKRISEGEFLEYAEVHGNLYGTSLRQVQNVTAAGTDVLLEIDVQGAAILHEKVPDAVSIFILPPSFDVLRDRLTRRATESYEDLRLRLLNSFNEVREYPSFRYLVVNDGLDTAVGHLRLIIQAERLKTVRQTDEIRVILDSFDASMHRFEEE